MWLEEGSGGRGRTQSDDLAALVEEAFPSLTSGHRRLEQSGGDHILLIVDDDYAFRFPRIGMHDLTFEIAVLQCLQRHLPIATPTYEYIDPAGRFAGYRLIKGTALTAARFAALPRAYQDDVLGTAARFLASLHGLAANTIAPLERWPSSLTPAEHAAHALTEYLPTFAHFFPRHVGAIEAFYNRYCRWMLPEPVVVHGDLVGEHILLDQHTGRLTGIIDFSDVALGDPAQDLLGLWAYGADAVRQVADLYRPKASDPGLIARSRDNFTRYRLERVFESSGSDAFDPVAAAAEFDTLLTA